MVKYRHYLIRFEWLKDDMQRQIVYEELSDMLGKDLEVHEVRVDGELRSCSGVSFDQTPKILQYVYAKTSDGEWCLTWNIAKSKFRRWSRMTVAPGV